MILKSSFPDFYHSIPSSVKLVVVSKNQPVESIQEIYDDGHRFFGENKAQELLTKYPLLPKDIEWHFIGHIQTNKVKLIAPLVHVIHSIDSLKLLQEVEKEARKNQRIIDCLLQFHIATEETKFGLNLGEARQILRSEAFSNLEFARITGVMGMATYSDDVSLVRNEFCRLKNHFDQLQNEFFSTTETFREISMGMSGDYQIAIEEGSTLVRLGTAIFGERNQKD